MTLNKCQVCKESIIDTEIEVSQKGDKENISFHAGCFKCATCKKDLSDEKAKFKVLRKDIYCIQDYHE